MLSEEADPGSGELLGNFPQAFSHVRLINAVWRLPDAQPPKPSQTTRSGP
ncbi:MAG: glycoside hydrolase family 15 protein [Pseudonocardiaceae bacterium]